ncbi:hypothetical protein HDU89_008376 [Geranomyces variabilis]|nr:hypothetical protein HDU89_008376 [Geranomyces variabilis]
MEHTARLFRSALGSVSGLGVLPGLATADFDEDLLGALLDALAGFASSLDEESSDDDTGTGTLILGNELTVDFKTSEDDDESLGAERDRLISLEKSLEELFEEESSEESLEEESSEESLEEESSEESLDEDDDEDERERRVGNLLRLTNGVGGDDNFS